MIPLSGVAKLEVHRGRKGHFWQGAGIGFVSVTTVATILCATAENNPSTGTASPATCTTDWSFVEALGLGTFVGLFIGFPVGGGLGALIRYDKWEPLELPAKPMVAVHPTGGIIVGLTIPVRR